jgi:lipoate-protein ligase A
LFDFDSEMLAGALRQENPSELRSEVASLKRCLGTVPTCEEVIPCLKQGFIDLFGVESESTSLNLEQQRYATELAHSQYAPLNWAHDADLPIVRQKVNSASWTAAKMA